MFFLNLCAVMRQGGACDDWLRKGRKKIEAERRGSITRIYAEVEW